MDENPLLNVPADRSRTPGGAPVRFLVIGRVLGPIGLNGDVRAQFLTDFPERFERLETVYVGESLRPHRVQTVRMEPGTAVLHFSGIDDATAAHALSNLDLQVPIGDAADLPPDQYFWHQIIGIEVWTDDGTFLGKVADVLRTGSNDVYVVHDGAREVLLPAIEDVVRSIDLRANRMVVHLLPGLVDEI